MTNHDLLNITQKTQDRASRTKQNWGVTRCTGRVGSSCSLYIFSNHNIHKSCSINMLQNLFLCRCGWSCLRPETYHHEHSTIMCVCNPILTPYVKVCKTPTLNREYQETYFWQGVSRNLPFTWSIKKPTLDWEFHRSFRYNCPVLPHHTHLVVADSCKGTVNINKHTSHNPFR